MKCATNAIANEMTSLITSVKVFLGGINICIKLKIYQNLDMRKYTYSSKCEINAIANI